MSRRVDQLAGTGNGPASIHRLQTIHDLAEIFGDRQITPRQFLQGPYAVLSMINRPQMSTVQQIGQLAGINAVALVSDFQRDILSRIADQHFCDVVKTCAVLTPSLGQSLDPVMARVQEPSNSNLGNCAETFSPSTHGAESTAE